MFNENTTCPLIILFDLPDPGKTTHPNYFVNVHFVKYSDHQKIDKPIIHHLQQNHEYIYQAQDTMTKCCYLEISKKYCTIFGRFLRYYLELTIFNLYKQSICKQNNFMSVG